MFDRGVAVHAATHGDDSLLRGALPFLSGNDAVIGNLEGTITTEPSIAQRDHSILHFTFDPRFAGVIRRAGFTAVSMANNHALDFYRSGFASTTAYLDAAGIAHFGSPYNDAQISTSIIVRGKRICLVGYHDLYSHDPSPAIAEIERIRLVCDLIAVMPHWGEEYHLVQTDRQTELGHEFIDAGADLVIGSHPHVVEPVEIYRGRAIFYSLGNFVFDQAFSFWVQHGLAVRAVVRWPDDGGSPRIDLALVPTTIHSAETGTSTPEETAKVLEAAGVPSGQIDLPARAQPAR